MKLPPLPATVPEHLTLDDCVNIALARSPFLKSALAQLDAASARVGQTASPLLPQATAAANWTRQEQPLGQPVTVSLFGINTLFQTPPQFITISQASVSLRQLIFDGGQIKAQVLGQIAGAKSLRQDIIHGARTLIYQVKKAYLEVLAAQAQEGLARKSLEDATQHRVMAQKSFEAGLAARADVVFAEVPVAQARLAIEKQRSSVLQARAALNRYLGVNLLRPAELDAHVPFERDAYTLEDAQLQARTQRADLLAQDDRIHEAERRLQAARAGDSLSVGMAMGYNWTGYNQEILPVHEGWNVGLNFSYPLLNGRLNEFRVREAEANLADVRAHRQELQEEVELQVTQAYLAWDLAQRELEANRFELQKALENLALVQGQYKAGLSTMLAVQDAEVQELQAESNDVQFRFGVDQALLQLEFAMGK